MSKTRVGLIFSVLPSETPIWPYAGYDYEKRANELLTLLKAALPEIDFINASIQNVEDVKKILDAMGDVDGYIVWLLSSNNAVPRSVIQRGKPTILIDDLYAGSGSFMSVFAMAGIDEYPVVSIAPSKAEDAFGVIKLLQALHKLRETTIVMVKDWEVNLSTVCKYIDVRELGWAEEQIKETINKLRAEFGVNVVTIGSKELIEVYNSINAKEANKWAVQWVSKAKAVVEPSEREILDAAKMYLAMRKLIEKYAAIGITIDCIVLPYLKRLPAYPCLGYAQLLDEGFIATCEADLDSAFTQLVIKYVTGEPGFVSNPVVDQTSGWVVYSHCVSATKIRGPDATSEPYRIRSHAEDRAGASLQVLWPPNEIVTAVKFNIREKKMAIHSGKIVGNIEEEKGCRTKVAVETNVDAILKNWNRQGKFGWHRVIVLGDWKNYLINFARLTGFKVIDELKN
jgi:hypothetical protein